MNQSDVLLQKLNDQMERMMEKLDNQGEKIDNQGQRLTGIEVKVDLYREAQTQVGRKVDEIDKEAARAMESTKSAHKRLDDFEDREDKRDDDVKFLKRSVIVVVLTLVGNIAYFLIVN